MKLTLIPEDDILLVRFRNYMKQNLYKLLFRTLVVAAVFLTGFLTITVVSGYNRFSADYQVKFELPFKNWIKIEPRTSEAKHLFKQAKAKEKDPSKMTTEEYICWKFGKDCQLALAVSQAENGSRQCDRFGVNTNKTIDFGVFQINTVHLKKGWTIAELIDCHKNVDYAYEIYQAQGFNPWVAFWSDSYKRFLN
jgi:hypothetical protein